jgi:hypothetical protein
MPKLTFGVPRHQWSSEPSHAGFRRESESSYCHNVCRFVGFMCGLFCLIFTVLDYKLTKRLPKYLASTEVRRNTQKEELALEQEQGDGRVVGIPANAAMLTSCFPRN